jgi:hypothetical protein
MQQVSGIRRRWILPCALSMALAAQIAQAVPSFARQTGMACEACHTVFPELTHFGRMFKANAYTLDNLKQVRDIDATKQELLSLANPAAAIGDDSDIGYLAQFAAAGRHRWPRSLADQHGRVSAAVQPVLCGQGRAASWVR